MRPKNPSIFGVDMHQVELKCAITPSMIKRLAVIFLISAVFGQKHGISAPAVHQPNPQQIKKNDLNAPNIGDQEGDQESDENESDADNETLDPQGLNHLDADENDDDELINGNITLATDYIHRGLSQTDQKPAIQGGFDFEHPLGIYANVWGSNVHFPGSEASMELDASAGYTYLLSPSMAVSLGVLRYFYLGDASRNNWEIPLKLTWKTLASEVDYAPHWAGDGHSWYLDLSWSDEVIWEFQISLGMGYSIFAGAQTAAITPTEPLDEEPSIDEVPASASQSPSYFDFRAALSHPWIDLDWQVAGSLINRSEEINGTPGNARLIFSVSKSF